MHSLCCSLGGEVINGSSHSVCSRQALLLPLPLWAACASLTPSQEEAKWMANPANGNENRMEGGGGFVKEEQRKEQARRQVKGLIAKIKSDEKTKG